jgi:hypothetical protein
MDRVNLRNVVQARQEPLSTQVLSRLVAKLRERGTTGDPLEEVPLGGLCIAPQTLCGLADQYEEPRRKRVVSTFCTGNPYANSATPLPGRLKGETLPKGAKGGQSGA